MRLLSLPCLGAVCAFVCGCLDIPATLDLPIDVNTDVTGINFGGERKTEEVVFRLEQQMMGLVNDSRAAAEVAEIPMSMELSEVARTHSLAMQAGRFFDHLDLAGLTPTDRVADAGIASDRTDEVIAFANVQRGVSAADIDAIHAELSSQSRPEERAILLDGAWTEMGIGVVLSDNQRVMHLTAVFIQYPPRVIGVD